LTVAAALAQSAAGPSSDTGGEAKKFEPQMNANVSVPNLPSELNLGFAMAKSCVTCER
jgi:hypothetical protein